MPPKTPPRRKGTAINNLERHAAAEDLAKSAQRYVAPKIQPLVDDKPKPNFRRAAPVEEQAVVATVAEGQGAPAKAVETGKTIPKAEPAKPKIEAATLIASPVKPKAQAEKPTANASARGNQAYAVRLLPAQVAVVSDIAARLNKDERYAQQIVQRRVKETLNTHRDNNSWSKLAEEAVRRIDDPHGEGVDFFKSVFRITQSELAAMKSHVDDPMSMFTDFKVTSAFAKAALSHALDAVDKATR